MKKIQVGIVSLLLSMWLPCVVGLAKRKSKSRASSLLLFAVVDARKELGWKSEEEYLIRASYIRVTMGKRYYIYSREGKLVKIQPAHSPSAGIMGNYAEVGWDYLDKNSRQFSDTYGHYLLRFKNYKWHVVARNGGLGYMQEVDLRKVGVPPHVIERLQLG